MALLSAQDKWQRQLEDVQQGIADQRAGFTHEKEDLYQKLTLKFMLPAPGCFLISCCVAFFIVLCYNKLFY